MNITWFKKDKAYRKSLADVTVSVTQKQRAQIIIRNGYKDEIAPESDYIMIGVPEDDQNKLVFMASKRDVGWKASIRRNKHTTYVLQMTEDRMVTLCQRFSGDYEMELYENSGTTLYCINRRNVL